MKFWLIIHADEPLTEQRIMRGPFYRSMKSAQDYIDFNKRFPPYLFTGEDEIRNSSSVKLRVVCMEINEVLE